jgi:hypothetical protein
MLAIETVEAGVNSDWKVSIAFGKFSVSLQTQNGRVNRKGVQATVGINFLELNHY